MSKHTPGPWQTDQAEHDAPYQDIRIHAGKGSICCVWIDDAPLHDYNAEQRANARLIAAAPELLEALKDMGARYGLTDQARAAIAKAEGQQRPEPTDSRDPIRKEQARLEMEAWARAKLARHGIQIPEDDDGPLAF